MPLQPAAQVFAETTTPRRPLAHAGAWAALAVVALMVVHTVIFLAWPPPGYEPTAANTRAWFELFSTQPLLALVNLDLLMLVDFACVLLVFLGISSVLWRDERLRGLLVVANVFAAVSAAVYFASIPAFTMQALARGYASATNDAPLYVAAGQATLAIYHGTPFDVGYVLSAVAGLLLSAAMLRVPAVFPRALVILGIVMFAMNLVPPTAGPIGLVLSMASLPLLATWLVLVARRLGRANLA